MYSGRLVSSPVSGSDFRVRSSYYFWGAGVGKPGDGALVGV